jgi:hypothetical protein
MSRRPVRASALVATARIEKIMRPLLGRRGREQYEEANDVVIESDDGEDNTLGVPQRVVARYGDDNDNETDSTDITPDAVPVGDACGDEQYEDDGFVVPDSQPIAWDDTATELDHEAHAANLRESRDEVEDALDELHATHLRIQMSDEQAFRMLFEAQARRALKLPLTDDLLAVEADPLSRPCVMRDSWAQFADRVLRSELWSPAFLAQQRERFTFGEPYPCAKALLGCDGKHDKCSMCNRRHATYHHDYLMVPGLKESSTEWVAGARCHRRAAYYRRFYSLHRSMYNRVQRLMGWPDKPKGEALLADMMAVGSECDAHFKYLNDLMRESALFVEEYINKQ